MIYPLPEHVWRRLVWVVFVTACLSFVLLGIAENGARGSTLSVVPSAPLPFARHRIMGLDLRQFSSAEAVRWLEAAGPGDFALTMLPVDPDIVIALSQPNSAPTAIAAMDTLVAAAGTSPLAVCLTRPPGPGAGLGVAQAAVGTLTERYPSRIAYVSACQMATQGEWQGDIAKATLNAERLGVDLDNALIPMAGGAPVVAFDLPGKNAITPGSSIPDEFPGGYTLLELDCSTPVSDRVLRDAAELLRERASIGLIVVRPERDLDPATLASSIRGFELTGNPLPEGFTSVTAPGITLQGDWNPSMVGTVSYVRSSVDGAALELTFVGTEIYVQALASPDGGVISAWIDPDPDDTGALPDAEVNLKARQASDAAELIMKGLPAARHRLVLVTTAEAGKSVSIAGFVVTGHPTPVWPARLASLVMLGLAIAALTERSLSAIRSIRRDLLRPGPVRRTGHPRVFNRSR